MGSVQRRYPFRNQGSVNFDSIIEGITFREEADEQTGHREKVVIETKDKTKIPSIVIEGKENQNIQPYRLAPISLSEGKT
jgi:DNA-directed RNA polymerase subunit beta'